MKMEYLSSKIYMRIYIPNQLKLSAKYLNRLVSDADSISRTGIDAKDIEVCSWHHINGSGVNGSGVCAVIGDPVDTLIEYRLNLTRCYRHGVSQTAGFSEVGTQVTGAIYGSSGTCAVILTLVFKILS